MISLFNLQFHGLEIFINESVVASKISKAFSAILFSVSKVGFTSTISQQQTLYLQLTLYLVRMLAL